MDVDLEEGNNFKYNVCGEKMTKQISCCFNFQAL